MPGVIGTFRHPELDILRILVWLIVLALLRPLPIIRIVVADLAVDTTNRFC